MAGAALVADVPAPTRWRRWWLAFVVALAVLTGPGFPVYRRYDAAQANDTATYLNLARGEYAGQSVTRRYRVVVPWLAAALATPLRVVADRGRLHQQTPLAADEPLRLAFFVVNSILLALAGALVWRTAEAADAPPLAAGLGMALALSSRWATDTAALPLTDSLYCLAFALAFYGVRARAGWAVLAAALMGPVAKESFVFLVPWLLWFGRDAVRWPRLLAAIALGYAVVVAVHLYVDTRAGTPAASSATNALHHFENITYSLRRLFSAHGVTEIIGIFGVSWLVLATGPVRGASGWWRGIGAAGRWLPAVVAVHLLLSGDLGRMGYLLFPVFGVAAALALSGWRKRSGSHG